MFFLMGDEPGISISPGRFSTQFSETQLYFSSDHKTKNVY